MKTLIARHRAAASILALIAIILFYVLPGETGGSWGDGAATTVDVLMILVALAAGWAVVTSPYLPIVYREAPLKRAVTGISNLDERELALRDRANGMTYYVFGTLNLIALVALGVLLERGAIVLQGRTLLEMVVPYACFAFALPVVMLEWFEPSSLWAQPIEEEEGA